MDGESLHIIKPAVIKARGECVGIENLDDKIAAALASDVQYRLQQLIQNALKFKEHSHRRSLRTSDIDAALRVANCEPLYGYSSSDPLVFQKTKDDKVFFVRDISVNLDDVISAPLPKIPAEPTFRVHWLAVDGVQPRVPQNPPLTEDGEPLRKKKKVEEKEPEPDIRPVVKHVLTKEQQMYYEKVTEAVKAVNDKELQDIAFKSLRSDAGLHQLVPYLVRFVPNEVNKNLTNLPVLKSLLRMSECLLKSPHIDVEPYLQQLVPAILTCLVGKRLCGDISEDHWSLRQHAALLVKLVCDQFGDRYPKLRTRISKTLTKALMNASKPLSTHYGAIIGLEILGPELISAVLVPIAASYTEKLRVGALSATPPAHSDSRHAPNARALLGAFEARQTQAQMCAGALLRVVGRYSISVFSKINGFELAVGTVKYRAPRSWKETNMKMDGSGKPEVKYTIIPKPKKSSDVVDHHPLYCWWKGKPLRNPAMQSKCKNTRNPAMRSKEIQCQNLRNQAMRSICQNQRNPAMRSIRQNARNPAM
eukprot:924635_1